jgi:hypothetical protein
MSASMQIRRPASRTGAAIGLAAAFAAVLTAFALSSGASVHMAASTEAGELASYGQLPLSFIPNRGQTDARVRYHAQAAGVQVFLTDNKAIFSFEKGKREAALEMRFLGANPDAQLVHGDRGAGTVNYLTGSEHQTGLPTFEEVLYKDLWPGIDMAFRGQAGKLKYEFHIAPGADPSRIRLAYAGADGLSLGAAGNLLIGTPLGTLRDSRPISYQRVGGERVPVASRYTLDGDTAYGFALGPHDQRRPLVIDPGLEYSSYLGGQHKDEGWDVAVDDAGYAYVTGMARSGTTFPTTPGAYDRTYNGNIMDAFVTKMNADGSALVYSTFLGGSGRDRGEAIAVDDAGSAYVTGEASTGFPRTTGAAQTALGGVADAFVSKLAPDGSALAYSTFVGGQRTDVAFDIAVDTAGGVAITGVTKGLFPTTSGAYDTAHDSDGAFCDDELNYCFDPDNAFVTRLNPAGSQFVFSTYLGGEKGAGNGVAIDGAGNVYVTGGTPGDHPTTVGAFDTSPGSSDGFVTKLNPTGTALVYSTFLGGSGFDGGHAIELDAAGNAVVAGGTSSTDFPITGGAFDDSVSGGDAFVTKVNTAGSALHYSTVLGGTQSEGASGVAVDSAGNSYVTGQTRSTDFPTTSGAVDTSLNSTVDTFLSKVSATGSALLYSTYLGGTGDDLGNGVAVDPGGNAFLAGTTVSADFPTTPGAFLASQPTTGNPTSGDAFVTKIDPRPSGYPRPKDATPTEVSLVPAYVACGAANREHGPPLAFPSCNPPAQASDEATLGTPDTNGRAAKGSGLVRYGVLGGDVQIKVDVSDVYESGAASDYVGELRVRTPLQITDRFNNPGDVATVTTQSLEATVPCAATVDATTGATCNLLTTVESLIPGAVPEGKRSVWALGQVQVDDGGADGDADTAADNTPFMVQGVFVP